MAIPYKLFMKMFDMEIDAQEKQSFADVEKFRDEIGWPWKASQEQLDEWSNWIKQSGFLGKHCSCCQSLPIEIWYDGDGNALCPKCWEDYRLKELHVQ